ncbi:hypothetical protein QN089_15920 (plasmid) [Kurthia sp. YJT4]|uniref:hypothetical protein n=1 Tax=Kurthia sp. YJT4 TaxID=3049086 RepID=UPI002550B2AD|nr:hypothetical protein [Kurthia sp. YJT4]WIL40223.1 hypothetical protein QN089_15920 [Kurthia sp. YJT4]
MNLQLLDVLVPKGINTYKKKHSKAICQGVLFVVREKAHFANGQVKGYILTSKESLLEDAGAISHFTPNVYRFGTYSD